MRLRAVYLIVFLCLSPILLFSAHVLIIRLLHLLKVSISTQKILINLIFLFNIPIVIISITILGYRDKGLFEGLLYSLLIFNSFAYAYFHFFNMSETARRIKILIGIKKSLVNKIDDIYKYYDLNNILNIRLKRLEQISQIQEADKDKYILKRKLLFTVSTLIYFWRSLLGMNKM